MVMGASVGEKLVMVCGTPSSRMRKFSFLRPGMMSPCCVVATTSRVTMGTSTAMVTPACGGGCAVVGAVGGGGFCCCGGGGEPPCGPVGAWARAEFSANSKTRAVARTASRITEKMAFIVHPSIAIEQLQTGDDPCVRDNMAATKRLNFSNATAMPRPSAHTCMLV